MGVTVRRAARLGAGMLVLALVAATLAAGSSGSAGVARRSWHLVLFDNFHEGVSSARWLEYSGPSRGDPGGLFRPSHVTVRHGMLDLAAYRDRKDRGRWVSGGLSSAPSVHQIYGKYEVRFRVDSGFGIGSDALLWPYAGRWPPEVDFAENDGIEPTRTRMYAFVHYGADNRQVQAMTSGNFTRWHTFGVQWTPGLLVFTIDGRTWARVRGAVVPSSPMAMDVQDVAGTCGITVEPCPNGTTPARVDMQVAWVRIYSYSR